MKHFLFVAAFLFVLVSRSVAQADVDPAQRLSCQITAWVEGATDFKKIGVFDLVSSDHREDDGSWPETFDFLRLYSGDRKGFEGYVSVTAKVCVRSWCSTPRVELVVDHKILSSTTHTYKTLAEVVTRQSFEGPRYAFGVGLDSGFGGLRSVALECTVF